MAAPNPRDRPTGFTVYWALWLAAGFGIPEAIAIRRDARFKDRRKRTLSSNTRWATGYDSITGEQVDVPFGRLRRLAFITFMAWFAEHIQRKRNNIEEV